MDEYRNQINKIDSEIVRLYKERMEVAKLIGEYKKENGLPIKDTRREKELLDTLSEMAGEEDGNGIRSLYSVIFELSRMKQRKVFDSPSELAMRMDDAVNSTEKLFPEKALVACQGTHGAYSQAAAEKLFKYPSIMFLSSFENVFSAVDKGLCRFGVLPLENSTAGSVNQIYDLMAKYNFSIVKTVRVHVRHSLVAPRGVKLEDIKEIYSHEQALMQCNGYLGGLKGVKVIPCENTAVAAQKVAESGRRDIAAISSKDCAELYDLNIIQENINDMKNNYTRFICISKKLEIYPGANKTSIMMVLPHRAGSLYKILARLNVLGINLNKLESRPLPERNFEFMFYFDIDESIYSPALRDFLCEAESEALEFRYLGSYTEVF